MTNSLIRITVRAQLAVQRELARRAAGERGDVPGWVLVTLMTAGLVTVLWAVAKGQLQALFTRALSSVKAP